MAPLKEHGFEFELFPAKTGQADSLLIYMHGVGDDASSFRSYEGIVQEKMPGTAVISLQAPLQYQLGGYTWFPYGGPIMPMVKTLLSHLFNRVSVAKQVEDFAHLQLEKLKLTENNLAYIANSMGAIVALQSVLAGKKPVGAVVSRGGSVIPFTKIRNRSTPVFMQVGEYDDMFNPENSARAKNPFTRLFNAVCDRLSLRHGRSVARLQKKGIAVAEKTYRGEGHMLGRETFSEGIDFISAALVKKPSIKI